MEKKNENLKYILTRYDSYISASNVKGSFIVTFNTFLVGSILVNRNTLLEMVSYYSLFNGVIFGICCCALLILFFTIRALFPYSISGNSSKDEYHSHIFFGSVSKFENSKEFTTSFNKLTDQKYEEDLATQIFVLSGGLSKKYKMLDYAMYIIYIELFLFLCSLIIIAI